jgi:hypothetical protein
MKQAVKPNGKSIETKKALSALIAAVRLIIGSRTGNVMNVNSVNTVKACAATP